MTLYEISTSLRDWAATIRKWKEFRQRAGKWPLFSIVASTLHTSSFIVGGAFLVWYSGKQRWSESHFVLIMLAILLPYVFVWAWLQNKIYLSGSRRAGLQGWSNRNVEHGHGLMHHKIKPESARVNENRAPGWSHLTDVSWHIDNAIFIIFLVLLAATFMVKAIFWLFGW